jgi:hypothetical protein
MVLGKLNISSFWRRSMRAWHRQLRREHTIVALLVLTLGLLEPLACVLHCTLWMPLHHQSTALAQEHQHHQHGSPVSSAVAHIPAEQRAPFENRATYQISSLAPGDAQCHFGSDAHHMPLAEPFHELAFVVLALSFVVLLICWYLIAPLQASPPLFLAVPLRPPIS